MTAFGDAFKAARKAGKKEFTFGGKSYHTKTKEDLATTPAKSKKVPVPTPRPKTPKIPVPTPKPWTGASSTNLNKATGVGKQRTRTGKKLSGIVSG